MPIMLRRGEAYVAVEPSLSVETNTWSSVECDRRVRGVQVAARWVAQQSSDHDRAAFPV